MTTDGVLRDILLGRRLATCLVLAFGGCFLVDILVENHALKSVLMVGIGAVACVVAVWWELRSGRRGGRQ